MAATYGAPGVYVEEKPSGSMPLQGVGTAVAAFVGFTRTYNPDAGDPSDPEGVKPQLVTSWPQYERIYGGFAKGAMLPHAVKGYFENGGALCYIVRIPSGTGDGSLPQRALPSAGRKEVESLVVEGLEPDTTCEVVIEGPPPAGDGQEQPSQEFTLKVVKDGTVREEFPGLTIGRGARGVDRVVNERSKLIRVQVQSAPGMSLAERTPAAGTYVVKPKAKTAATVKATPQQLEGSEVERTGYQGLAIADEEIYLAAQGKLVDWCEGSGTRMAILDAPPGLSAQRAMEWRSTLGKDSAFGAAYYPHLVVANPLATNGSTNGERFLTVPPSGHVAGVWARTDAVRGVWKAPANEIVRGVARLEQEQAAVPDRHSRPVVVSGAEHVHPHRGPNAQHHDGAEDQVHHDVHRRGGAADRRVQDPAGDQQHQADQ